MSTKINEIGEKAKGAVAGAADAVKSAAGDVLEKASEIAESKIGEYVAANEKVIGKVATVGEKLIAPGKVLIKGVHAIKETQLDEKNKIDDKLATYEAYNAMLIDPKVDPKQKAIAEKEMEKMRKEGVQEKSALEMGGTALITAVDNELGIDSREMYAGAKNKVASIKGAIQEKLAALREGKSHHAVQVAAAENTPPQPKA